VRLNVAGCLVTNTTGVFSYKHVRTWTQFKCVPRDSALVLTCPVRVLATGCSCWGLHDHRDVRRSVCTRFLSDPCRFMSQTELVSDELDKVWQEMVVLWREGGTGENQHRIL